MNVCYRLKIFCSAILFLLAGGALSAQGVLGPFKWGGEKWNATRERLVVYYIGGSGCPGCVCDATVAAVRTIKAEFAQKYPRYVVQFNLVCLDTNFWQAVTFIDKFGGGWDELSIGNHFHNELALRYLPQSRMPAVPHILVVRDTVAHEEKKGTHVRNRTLVADQVGPDEFEAWIQAGFPLQSPGMALK